MYSAKVDRTHTKSIKTTRYTNTDSTLYLQEVQKYLEFNTLDASYVYQKGGTIGKVPATGGEAVSTNLVGFFQKRRLKNFLQMLHNCPKNQIELNETHVVDFKDGPLGLRLVPLIKSTGIGSTVTAVGGQSKESGKIKVGDILTHVAGKDVRGASHADILKMIKGASRPLAVSFQSPPSARDSKFDLVTHSAKELYEYWVLEEDTQDFVRIVYHHSSTNRAHVTIAQTLNVPKTGKSRHGTVC